MKTNIINISIDGTNTYAKFIGDFDYEIYGDTRCHYLDEQTVFANVYQLLDGSMVTVLHDGKVHITTKYELCRIYDYTRHHGGKKHRKLARLDRIKNLKHEPEEELPF